MMTGIAKYRWTLGLALSIVLAAGCKRERASAEACGEIFDRIVEVELQEQGFRDPVLARRKREELRGALGSELRRCEGRRLPAGALACVRTAKSTEEISHTCLR